MADTTDAAAEQVSSLYKTNQKEYMRQYYVEHKDEISTRFKNYYQQNKSTMLQKFECGCGSTYSKPNKSNHIKTAKHQKWQAANQTDKLIKQ